jgi:hypothetical protein
MAKKHEHGSCKACGACKQCEPCDHCGSCRVCGKPIYRFTYYNPFYLQPHYVPVPVWPLPGVWMSGPVDVAAGNTVTINGGGNFSSGISFTGGSLSS